MVSWPETKVHVSRSALAARYELPKFKHNPVQHVHLLLASFPLAAAEITEGVNLLLICFAVPSFYIPRL